MAGGYGLDYGGSYGTSSSGQVVAGVEVHDFTLEWIRSLGEHLARGTTIYLWADGIGGIAGALDDLVGGEVADGGGWSKLLDVDRADEAWLPWLGQFVGVRIPEILRDVEQRAYIRDRVNWRRGTPEAIRAAARPFLRPGTGDVQLVERPGGEAYQLTINVRDDQIGGNRYYRVASSHASYTALAAAVATYDDLIADITGAEAAALAAVPAGIVATFSVVPNFTYGDVGAVWATYSALAAALPSYAALSFYDPS